MRVAQNEQMLLGKVDVSNIAFDPKSRDSFVLETHVHFLIDINLLLDAMRKCTP